MIGIRTGIAAGPRFGIAAGISEDELAATAGGLPGVTRDSSSGIYCPANASEWTAVMAAAGIGSGNPSGTWLCQEASGNLVDQIGALALIANGTPLYLQSAAGWARFGVGFNAVANQRFTANVGTGPSPATTSQLWLFYMSITATPGATAVAMNVSDGATNFRTLVTTTPRIQSAIAGVTATGTQNPTATGIQPMVMLYDRTNLAATIFTGQEKITNTYSAAVVDGRKGIGGALSPTGQCVYGAMFQGAAAELTSAQIKTLLTTLGWSIPWS